MLFKQTFACANTANCVAALETVLCVWHILLDDLGRISVGCVQKCVVSWLLAWKIEDIWMPLTTSVLTCSLPSCVLCHPPSRASALPMHTAHPGLGAVPSLACGITDALLCCCSLRPCSYPLGHIWQSFHRHREEEKPPSA